MSDLIHNYYAVEGMSSKEQIAELVKMLNERFGRKENSYGLTFFPVHQKQEPCELVCADDENTDSNVAVYLSEAYPDRDVFYYSTDEFDPEWEMYSKWRNGQIQESKVRKYFHPDKLENRFRE